MKIIIMRRNKTSVGGARRDTATGTVHADVERERRGWDKKAESMAVQEFLQRDFQAMVAAKSGAEAAAVQTLRECRTPTTARSFWSAEVHCRFHLRRTGARWYRDTALPEAPTLAGLCRDAATRPATRVIFAKRTQIKLPYKCLKMRILTYNLRFSKSRKRTQTNPNQARLWRLQPDHPDGGALRAFSI